jgi:hypothetical protein
MHLLAVLVCIFRRYLWSPKSFIVSEPIAGLCHGFHWLVILRFACWILFHCTAAVLDVESQCGVKCCMIM